MWAVSECQVCLRSVEHCYFVVVGAAAADFVEVVSIADLDRAQAAVDAEYYLLQPAGVP